MTNVTYTFTNKNGQRQTTSSYTEMRKNIAKGSPFDTIYTPIVEEFDVPETRKRIRL